jgi:para-nitrobenzyl esterase
MPQGNHWGVREMTATETRAQTTAGTVEGGRERGVLAFRGIAYAAPPIGPLRFRAPEPPAGWSGGRAATEPGHWAPQPEPLSTLGSEKPGPQDEDCLTLNVWTPALDGARPVMVWIHGGGFTAGSGASGLYRGDRLAARGDVVVVTINYRLGILGFLAHPGFAEGGEPAGNWGLLDQIAALRWVRDNIAAFGGDPGNVTVFGESAGSISVNALLAAPAAAGLFHQAIAQSGAPGAMPLDAAAAIAAKVMAELGVSDPAALRDVPLARIMDAQAALLAERRGGPLPLSPVVDGSVLPEPPLERIVSGRGATVPLMIGTNRDEYKMFIATDPRGREPDEAVVRRRIERTFGVAATPLTPSAALEGYRRIRSARGDAVTPLELWSAIESDRMFRINSLRAAAGLSRFQPQTYCYLFDWESPALRGALGACHALELPFVFGTFDHGGMDRFAGAGPDAERLSTVMQDAWLAFARSGDPSHPGIGTWPAYEPSRRATMRLGRTVAVEDAPLEAERLLWEGAG